MVVGARVSLVRLGTRLGLGCGTRGDGLVPSPSLLEYRAGFRQSLTSAVRQRR